MRTVRSLWTCYGADITFHGTYFWLLVFKTPNLACRKLVKTARAR